MNNNELHPCYYEAYQYHLAIITEIEIEKYRQRYEEEIKHQQRLSDFNREFFRLFPNG